MMTDDMFNPHYTEQEIGGGDNTFLRLADGEQSEVVLLGKWEATDLVYCERSVKYDPDVHGSNKEVRVRTRFLLNVAQRLSDGWAPKVLDMSWSTKEKYHEAIASGANGKYPFNYRRKGTRFNTEYYFTPMLNKPLKEQDLDEIKSLHYPNLAAVASEAFAAKPDDPPPQLLADNEGKPSNVPEVDATKVASMSDDLGLGPEKGPF